MRVCERCNDTHSMSLGEKIVPCTACPTPCSICSGPSGSAYCAATPCSCTCHLVDKFGNALEPRRMALDRNGNEFLVHAPDPVKPRHYKDLSPEPIDVIAAWKLGFNLGNVVKYTARADLKGTPLVDLKKAAAYLAHEIALREREASF